MGGNATKVDRQAALAALRQGYDNSDRWMRQPPAGGVVGRLSPAVPVEPILAAGRTPVLLKPPLQKPTPTADIYLDPILSPRTCAFFQAAVDGEYAGLDLLVLGRNDDKLYYYLKEIQRLGRAPALPPFCAFDLMMNRRDTVGAYNRAQFDGLCGSVERATGVTLTDAALAEAAAATRRIRDLQRRLDAARAAGKLSGVDAMTAIGAGYFMAPDDYAAALSDYVTAMEAAPALAPRPRLLVMTSEPLSFLDLHQRLEAAGAWVVGEDDAWGARAHGDEIDAGADAREAIFQRAWRGIADPAVLPDEAREAWIMDQCRRADIAGVVFYVPPSDRQFGWDYPRLAREIQALGKPTLLLRQDALDAGADLERQAADFLASEALAGDRA